MPSATYHSTPQNPAARPGRPQPTGPNSATAGLEPGRGVPVSLGPLLDSVVEFYGPLAAEQGLSLRRRGASDAMVSGDISWLRQLFGNPVEDACGHTPPGGWIELRTERVGVRGRQRNQVHRVSRQHPKPQVSL